MKVIYQEFIGGLSPFSETLGQAGSYADGRDLDPHRKPGYIMPGYIEDANNRIHSSAGVLTDPISYATIHPVSGSDWIYGYAVSKLYNFRAEGISASTAAGLWPHTTSYGQGGTELFWYDEGDNKHLYYVQNTYIGRCTAQSAATFDDDYLSDTSGAIISNVLQSGKDHPALINPGDGIAYIGNGRYLASLDGVDGSNSFNASATHLPRGWEITDLFVSQNYIGICAWQERNKTIDAGESAVFLWDANSDLPEKKIPIEDNYIASVKNYNGDIYLITGGRGIKNSNTLRKLTATGSKVLFNFKFKMEGSTRVFNVNRRSSLDIYLNRLVLGAVTDSYRLSIFSWGSTNPLLPKDVINQTYSLYNITGADNNMVGFVGALNMPYLFASFFDGTNSYWTRFYQNASSNAYYKGLYKEFGQRIRVNYVKFYFDTLAEGDSITPTLELNDDTSITLKDARGNSVISYAKDGAITNKRFNVNLDCHRFRPVLTWGDGDTAFSRIVVDYQFIDDKSGSESVAGPPGPS